jgi:hypothetical protein
LISNYLAMPGKGTHDRRMAQLTAQRWRALARRIAFHPIGIAVLYVAAIALTMFLVLTFQSDFRF